MAEPREWTLEIPGELHALRMVRELADRIAEELQLDPDTAFHVKVAMSEAATNGVVHGCRSSVDRVRVRARADAEALTVEVVDPGGRFDAPVGPADPLAPSGRGTILLEATTDEVAVDIAPGRTTVRLVKRLAPAGAGNAPVGARARVPA
jgi:serine/threonine-protein kinase RsbW